MSAHGINTGDLEALDLRKLALEMTIADNEDNETRRGNHGSPRPSSDTLSVSRARELQGLRRGDRTRVWKKVRKPARRRTTAALREEASRARSRHDEEGK